MQQQLSAELLEQGALGSKISPFQPLSEPDVRPSAQVVPALTWQGTQVATH